MRCRYVFAWLLASGCGFFLWISVGDNDASKGKVHARFSFAALGRFFSCRDLDADGASGSPSV